MAEETILTPKLGDKKCIVIKNVPSGLVNKDIDLNLVFRKSGTNPGEKKCMKCGYDHSRGIWSGDYGYMSSPGRPGMVFLSMCPVCELKSHS